VELLRFMSHKSYRQKLPSKIVESAL
jgi:hypothetical protein